MTQSNVLVVDDEQLIRASLRKAFERDGYRAEMAGSAAEAQRAIESTRPELVVLDLRLGDGDGLELLRRLRADVPETKVIVITAHGSVETAVTAMKLGAYDFVMKPFELDEILATAKNAVAAGSLEKRVAYHEGRARREVDDALIRGTSLAMERLDRELAIVAAQPVPVVLLVGETGTGKSLVARQVHYASTRARGPFVELNVAAIPDTLVESELFGHERGAFSDARERKPGLVEIADGGTLFLDEVGDLSLASQAKLLSFLESFAFRRVGGTVSRSVDVRVVAATNRDLATMAAEQKFRADLFYRLASVTLSVPPLRDRPGDIVPLAQHFLTTFASRYRKRFQYLARESAALLDGWGWPGNVRELKGVINRAVLMNDGEELLPTHLPTEIVAGALDPVPRALPEAPTAHIPTLEEIELRYMRAVLALTGGNKVRAAEHLGISRQTLGKRLGESE